MADQERSKGFSLRKKTTRRPPAQDVPSLPVKARQGLQETYARNGSSTDVSIASRQPRGGGTTSDLVKKRYSVRYNQAPDFSNGDAPPIPGIPQIPKIYASSTRSREPSPSQQREGVDIKVLKDPLLQADDYVTKFLSTASEHDLQEYQKSLKKVKNRASTDLQHNVYQNRTQFIKISKEAEKLKGDMQTLRGLMTELTTTLGQSYGRRSPSFDDGATIARKKANRSSVANLEAMWNTQLQALWKNIEGSQKFLPAIPGRHIIQESGYWVELDAATWKPRRPVHIVLLNEHLLVATRKRKRIDPNTANATQKAPTKLVADRCWPLQDIDIMDLVLGAKDVKGARETKEITNAVTIRHGQESFTYRNDRPDGKEKSNLLLAFKRTMDELRKAGRVEVDDTPNKIKEAMNYLSTRDPAIAASPGLLRSLSKSKDCPEILIDVDGKQRNLRWVEGKIDELDIEVALQHFEEAVGRVEQLRRLARGLKNNLVAQELIIVKVDERANKLAELLTQCLTDTHAQLSATQTNISYLTRLSLAPVARQTYLSARSALLTRRARQCVFEGDLLDHITEVSYIYFTLIKNTVSVYQQCFPPAMMSACIVWAKEHLDVFNGILERGLSSVRKGSQVWVDCLERAREMAGWMDEVGLDFRGLVGTTLDAGKENSTSETLQSTQKA